MAMLAKDEDGDTPTEDEPAALALNPKRLLLLYGEAYGLEYGC